MSKHTPGPWEAEKTSGAYVVCEVTEGWSVVPMNADPNKYSPEDDARLIAAAPDLLEALELADAMLSGANMNVKVVERKVKAALGKGKGEKDVG